VNSSFLAKPFMNVRNILWGRLHGQLTFTTRLGLSYLSGPGDKASYALLFAPAVTDSGVPGNPDANYPSETTPATGQDVPGTCRSVAGGTLDSWIVTVNPPAVGALMRDTSKGSPVQSGQYTMPFQLLIRAKSCLPF
jgi:hypothetical protein